MKKMIRTILFAILLFSSLGLTAFANPGATLSEDYQTLTKGDTTYTRVNTAVIEVEYYQDDYTPVGMSQAQKEMIQSVSLQHSDNELIVIADIVFKDGATMSISYLQTDYLEEYKAAVEGHAEEYVIDFEYPQNNQVFASQFDMKVNDSALSHEQVSRAEYYDIYVESEDQELTVNVGYLLVIDEEYFFVPFAENEISNYGELIVKDEVKAHQITNEDLVAKLSDAETTAYVQGAGLLFDDDLNEKIAKVFLIIVFGVIPFIIFVPFLILAIRSKTFYKKLFWTICILSVSIMALATLVAILIF